MTNIEQHITVQNNNGTIIQSVGSQSLEGFLYVPAHKKDTRGIDYGLLEADTRAVKLLGRVQEMQSLHEWLKQEERGHRLYHAEGGMGKTRLMLQLCDDLLEQNKHAEPEERWVLGFVNKDANESITSEITQLLAQKTKKVLLIVDYAESRSSSQLEAIAKLYKAHPYSKIVLLSRAVNTEEGWYPAFCSDAGGKVHTELIFALQPLATSPENRIELYRNMYHELQLKMTGVVTSHTIPPQLHNPKLENTFSNTLMLYILALAQLQQAENLDILQTKDDLLHYAANREKKQIAKLFAQEGIPITASKLTHPPSKKPAPLDVVVSCVALGLKTDPQHTALTEVLETCGFEKELSEKIADVLTAQYGRGGQEIAPLQPDLLQEYWVWNLSDASWQKTLDVLSQYKLKNFDTALTLFERLSHWKKTTEELNKLQQFLQYFWQQPKLLVHSYNQCLNSTYVFAQVFTQVFEQKDSLEDAKCIERFENLQCRGLLHIELSPDNTNKITFSMAIKEYDIDNKNTPPKNMGRGFMESHTNLNVLFALVYEQRVSKSDDLARKAGFLNNLGNKYSATGQREEALIATREAVELYRTLAAENSRAFNPDLASSLNNLGIRYNELGQREKALTVTREAVEIRRILATENPRAFNPDLAMSLNNLGVRYSEMGQREEALTATREAVELYGTLAAKNPRAFNPDLARSLNNLGVDYSALGQREEALTVTREAVELYGTLAAENPRAFNPDLAMSLNSLGADYSALGQCEEALTATREAVELRRTLATENPEAFGHDFAISLNSLGDIYQEMQDFQQAVDYYAQSIRGIQPYATAYPQAFGQRLQWYVQKYVDACKVLGIPPDPRLSQL